MDEAGFFGEGAGEAARCQGVGQWRDNRAVGRAQGTGADAEQLKVDSEAKCGVVPMQDGLSPGGPHHPWYEIRVEQFAVGHLRHSKTDPRSRPTVNPRVGTSFFSEAQKLAVAVHVCRAIHRAIESHLHRRKYDAFRICDQSLKR